jgi:hypothetical protein
MQPIKDSGFGVISCNDDDGVGTLKCRHQSLTQRRQRPTPTSLLVLSGYGIEDIIIDFPFSL